MATETSKRDPNYVTTLMGVDLTTGLYPTKVYVDENTHRLLVNAVVSGNVATTSAFGLPAHDYISLAVAATTDTYTFKFGGAGGSTVATVVITYTDSTKVTISTVART